MFQYVSTADELSDLVDRMAGSEVLAIDTEFLRERTYYAKLCLVQLATDDEEAIVDPLKAGDMTPLARLLEDPQTVKVFHSGSQDIEILLRATGVMPVPLFDTQVAASILGHHQQIGYGALVKSVCNVELPKADSVTDWTHRPLSKTQLKYAIDDVHYLPTIYRTMVADLAEQGRTSWTQADFSHLSDPATYENDPQESWRRVKRISSLSRPQLAALQVVAAWREETAQRKNLPRRWVLSDEVVVEIARRLPTKVDDVLSLRSVSSRMSTATCRKLIARIQQALKGDPETWPQLPRRHTSAIDTEAGTDLLTALAHLRSRENSVSTSLLAPHDDIVRLAAGQTEGNCLVEGWRKQLVGDDMLALAGGAVYPLCGHGRSSAFSLTGNGSVLPLPMSHTRLVG